MQLSTNIQNNNNIIIIKQILLSTPTNKIMLTIPNYAIPNTASKSTTTPQTHNITINVTNHLIKSRTILTNPPMHVNLPKQTHSVKLHYRLINNTNINTSQIMATIAPLITNTATKLPLTIHLTKTRNTNVQNIHYTTTNHPTHTYTEHHKNQ